MEPQQAGKDSPAPYFPEPCDFDLTNLMDSAGVHLDDKRGLVGLVIPCAEDKFQKQFCDRLKKEIGRRNIEIRSPLGIHPFISIEEVVRILKRYEAKLIRGRRDVVCPMPVSIFDPSSQIPEQLWKAVSEEFKHIESTNRLILIMYGQKNAVFPKGPFQISPPVFKEADVRRWVVQSTRLMDWKEEIWRGWKQHMLERCRYDDGGPLDIRLVYEYLEFSTQLLQQRLPEEEFIQELKSGF